jgi:lipopolysaccharide export system permease protein
MLTILDKYILKRYLSTFTVMILLFIPIGITIDVSEKVNKMIENHVPFSAIAQYYLDFTIYFANLLFPIFLFLSIIWFTSKLANNTEIIAILSSGISFTRFLRPYIIGATIVSIFALLMGFFLVPKASEGFNNFRYTYLIGNGQNEIRDNSDVFNYYDDASLKKLMSSFPFPKIYNTSIGKYAVFIENETKPLVFFNTREKAFNVAQKKADSGIYPVYVVDVPCVEIDDPKDFRYNVNENKYYTEMISNEIDDSKDIEIVSNND